MQSCRALVHGPRSWVGFGKRVTKKETRQGVAGVQAVTSGGGGE